MPNARKGETKSDFMERCIPILISEGRENDQAVAICSSMYDERKLSVWDKLEDSE